MPAYAIAQVHATDEEQYAAYLERIPHTIKRYGGKYVVRGVHVEVVVGESPYERVVVVEFDSIKRAQEWVRSPD